MIVDSHCHASDRWYEPVEALLFQMDRHRVERAVLVQLLGQFDNAYQSACVRAHEDRLTSVVAVDATVAHAGDDLRRLSEQGARGVRLRPSARSPGDDPLAIWRSAQALGLVVSCVGTPASFADPPFAALLGEVPRLQVVLEHLGGTSTPDGDGVARSARIAVFGLARFDNVSLKLPGLGELCPRAAGWSASTTPFESGMPEVVAKALDAFGAERLMWGSDFPPVASREGYGLALSAPRAALNALSAGQIELIFGGNARRVFGF